MHDAYTQTTDKRDHNPVRIALVGVSGYGKFYLKTLLDNETCPDNAALTAAIDPYAHLSPYCEQLRQNKIPVFDSLESFYSNDSADIVIVSSPIHLHCLHTCLALKNKSHVLCEKPVAVTVEEVRRMIRTRDQAQRKVGVGYQLSWTTGTQRLKTDIRDGVLGKPIRMKALCLVPRARDYYTRNTWAGKKQTENGSWVLDSPANNATAHYLHHMLYLLGPELDRSATPVSMTAELYRINPVENYDTAAFRVFTDTGAEILFFTSHAVREARSPVLQLEFEHATVACEEKSTEMTAVFTDGSVTNYGNIMDEPHTKVHRIITAVTEDEPIPCGIEAASAHTVVINGAQFSTPAITDFPSELIATETRDQTLLYWGRGLQETLQKGFAENKLPAELPVAWARTSGRIDLRPYWLRGRTEINSQ